MKPGGVTKLEYALLVAVLAWAIVLRAWDLNRSLFWVDEAESTINALTILEHGYPVDHYLGIPIYENSLTLPWPDSPEYEFRDSSYSKKGVAIYHGWLPLYSIAASLKAFGIKPDPPPAVPMREYTPTFTRTKDDVMRMTVAARVPAIVFGVGFLVLLFFTARELGGRDVGWAAFVVAAIAHRTVDIAREARYYSAAALLGLACCLMVFRMVRRRRWQDFVIGGVVFALLFHTHVVTFLVASAAMALAVIAGMRDRSLVPKLCAFAGIVAVATVPWLLLTGFLENASAIPKARPYLRFPNDYWLFPMRRPLSVLVLSLGVWSLLAADVFRHKLPPRFVKAFLGHRGAFYLLAAWVALGYVAFIFLMPAVSFVADRMTLPMLGAGIVLASMVFAAAARVIMGRPSPVLATGLFFAFMVAVGGFRWVPTGVVTKALSKQVEYTLDWLRDQKFRPGTRVYATPNKHLIFSVYTGMPVQNIAPVRKSFIDSYDRDMVVIEGAQLFQPMAADRLIAVAETAGKELGKQEAADLSNKIVRRAVAKVTAGTVRAVRPAENEITLPDYAIPLVDQQPSHTAWYLQHKANPANGAPAVFRGYPLSDWSDWWPIYFYRFVSPEKRSGPNLNYAERARAGSVTILPIGWRVYLLPPPDAVQDLQQPADKGISAAANPL